MRIFRSFKYALEGLSSVLKTESNWKIGLIEAFLVVLAGFFFNITLFEWVIVFLMIGLVLTLELINTAIEIIVDSFTRETHPRAKLAKDISAAAVVIAVLTAAIVGSIIFLPYFLLWITLI